MTAVVEPTSAEMGGPDRPARLMMRTNQMPAIRVIQTAVTAEEVAAGMIEKPTAG
jgi:hypothetical protein